MGEGRAYLCVAELDKSGLVLHDLVSLVFSGLK